MNPGLARAIDYWTARIFEIAWFRRSHHFTNLVELGDYQARHAAQGPEEYYRTRETISASQVMISAPRAGYRGPVRDFALPSLLRSPWPENNVVRGRIYEYGAAPRAAVVVLHGWLSFSYAWYRSVCRSFNRWGMHGVLMELPHHMSRRPHGSVYSGEFALSGDLTRTVEAFRQAVVDARQLIQWLRSYYRIPVGIWGISLGGWIGAMLCTLSEGPEAAVLVAPVVEPMEVLQHSMLTSWMRRDVRTSGLRESEYEEGVERLSPAHYRPSMSCERILIIRPEEDRAIPGSGVERLRKSWAGAAYKTYPHGHISIVLSRAMMRDSGQFLAVQLGSIRPASSDRSQAIS